MVKSEAVACLTAKNNSTARWVRWVLGFVIPGMIAIACLAAGNWRANGMQDRSITAMNEYLERIDTKLDLVLEKLP